MFASHMANFINRYPLNVPGKYYVDADCTDCDLCRETAPNNFWRDDEIGVSYLYKQPTTPEEILLCEDSREGCPTEAIGNDGEQFDWKATPIRDWSQLSEDLRPSLEGLNILTPEQERLLPRTWLLRPPQPRSPEELLDMLLSVFPSFHLNLGGVVQPDPTTFHSILRTFLPYFESELTTFSDVQINSFGTLITDGIVKGGELKNAFQTCVLGHLPRMNATKALWIYLSPNARGMIPVY